MIGAALAKCAVNDGIEVLCIIRKNSSKLGSLPQSPLIKIEYCNIDEYNYFTPDGSYNVFYHLAWEKTQAALHDEVDTQITNVRYTLDAVRLAKRLGCKKFIGIGSQAEYGIVTEPLKPETPVNPESGYGIAKYAAGKMSCLLCTQLGMEFNWLRILNVFGPLNRADTLITYTIRELRAGRLPEFTKCEQIWDYLFCDDAAKAFLAIGKNGINGKTYPLVSGVHRKLSEYLELIRDIVAPGVMLQFGKKDYYSHQPMYLSVDISELTKDTGWKPEVSFEEGIKKIIYEN